MEELLTGRQWVFKVFENGIFPMRKRDIFDDDYDDDELCPKEALTPRIPRTPTTPLVILNPPPGRSTQGRRIEILPSK